jgi:hypothetical protein
MCALRVLRVNSKITVKRLVLLICTANVVCRELLFRVVFVWSVVAAVEAVMVGSL